MSVDWTVDIQVTKLAEHRATITAIRTETTGVPPDEEVQRRTYRIDTQYKMGLTKAQNVEAWGVSIWGLYQEELAREANVSAFVSDMETTLSAGLNGQEP